MKKTRYIIKYKIGDIIHESFTDMRIDQIKYGFWVNEKFEPTVGSNSLYYILPHMVLTIKKVFENEQEEN